MPAIPIDQLKHRESWTFAEASAVWGYPAKFFKGLYATGEVEAYLPVGRKRVRLSAVSVRAYFERQRVAVRAQPAKKLTAKQWAVAEGLVS